MLAWQKPWRMAWLLAAGGILVASLVMACASDPPTASMTPVEGSGAVVVVADSDAFNVERIQVRSGATTTITLENH